MSNTAGHGCWATCAMDADLLRPRWPTEFRRATCVMEGTYFGRRVRRKSLAAKHTVPHNTPPYLKLHNDSLASGQSYAPPSATRVASTAQLSQLCDAFSRATGYALEFVPGHEEPIEDPGLLWSAPVDPGVGTAPGHLRLDLPGINANRSTDDESTVAACELADRLSLVFGQLVRTQQALVRREAELAASLPLSIRGDFETHVALRVKAVLKSAAEAIECEAAAIYLIDDAESELKLRASWGLPTERLLDESRSLVEARADVEALSGQAVVLEDALMHIHWNVPEVCTSCICVPLVRDTVTIGTLWLYCHRQRPFPHAEVNLAELTAGRVVAELERELLQHKVVENSTADRQITTASRLLRNQLPTVAPMIDGWEVAGWTADDDGVGTSFHDWFATADGSLAVAAGQAEQGGLDAALCAQMLRTAIRSHSQYEVGADRVLRESGIALWNGSAGDRRATLAYAALDSVGGVVRFAAGGDPCVLLLRPDAWPEAWESLTAPAKPVGAEPDTNYLERIVHMEPGQVLLICTPAVHNARNSAGRILGQRAIA
ncbi:MAG: SpoIIE family protein phosphatase, partial [Pirellulales bacterium]|nr:SpoIIE family protein phosphatase [Pirellulales bacterium]